MSNPTNGQPIPIYTIGYGDRTIEHLVDLLQRFQIAYLLDVRSAPYSRFKPEFSKPTLEHTLATHGIRYLFVGDSLGGRPDEPALYSDGKVDYAKLAITELYQQGIGRLQKAFAQQQRIVLMCSEGKPENCHRSRLIGATLNELAIPVLHIDENDALQTQEAVIYRLTAGQLSLFGEPTFTSRKRYQPAAEEEEDDDEA
jgi:uncharacterized protein (DUF488 family)